MNHQSKQFDDCLSLMARMGLCWPEDLLTWTFIDMLKKDRVNLDNVSGPKFVKCISLHLWSLLNILTSI